MSVCAKLSAPKGPAQRGLDVLSTSQTVFGLTKAPAAPRLVSRKGPYLVDQTTLGALQGRALREGGALYSPWDDDCPRTFWPIHGRGRDRCIKPVIVVLNNGENECLPGGSAIELHVRCRICEPCLKARSAWWKLRSMAEILSAPRTWFVTLTWRPETKLRAEYAADRALLNAGVRSPSPQDLFRARLKVLGPDVSRWFQRLRKGRARAPKWWNEARDGKWSRWEPARFRYLLVWEEHNSDETSDEYRHWPHAHLLIHEIAGHTLVKRRISGEWWAGFDSTRLVEQVSPEAIHRDAAYVCKYLSKSMLSRVRSSTEYGRKMPDFERSS